MKLIADCGSTKIAWGLSGSVSTCRIFTSVGINATLLSSDQLCEQLMLTTPDEIKEAAEDIKQVWFYAAGCRTAEHKATISAVLAKLFPMAYIDVDSDLVGAARSLCGHSDGIACILGTGSNSCVYSPADGGKIIASVSPLGYILGDEGSGTAIGKGLLADYLKGIMPENESRLFSDFIGMNVDQLIERVYRGDAPNRFLASIAPFAILQIGSDYIERLVENCFALFFERNVCQLPDHKTLPIHFTGSIAAIFERQLRATASRYGLTVTSIAPNPLEQLVSFHCSQVTQNL